MESFVFLTTTAASQCLQQASLHPPQLTAASYFGRRLKCGYDVKRGCKSQKGQEKKSRITTTED